MILNQAHTETDRLTGKQLMQKPFGFHQDGFPGWVHQISINPHGNLLGIDLVLSLSQVLSFYLPRFYATIY